MDHLKKIFAVSLLYFSNLAYAVLPGNGPFLIVPMQPLPTSVTIGQTTKAFYTVTNRSNITRTGHQRYPVYDHNVIQQVTSDSDYPDLCGTSFTLQGGQSCTLEYLISGAVNWAGNTRHERLFLCYQDDITCSGTDSPLNVILADLLPFVGVGKYEDEDGIQSAGTASSFDNGNTWRAQTINKLPGNNYPILNGVSCNNNACVGAGINEVVVESVGDFFPLIAYNPNIKTNAWSSIQLPLPASPSITPAINFNWGFLYAIDCPNNTCIAVGKFVDVNYPASYGAIEISTGNRQQWTAQALTPPTGATGYSSLGGISCVQNKCFAVGYSIGLNLLSYPIVTSSTNLGATWSALTLLSFTQVGELNAIKCTGNTCVAVGTYLVNGESARRPGTAITINSGDSWSLTDLTPQGFSQGTFNGITYFDNNFIAVGHYYASDPCEATPVVATSSNNGSSWTQHVLTLSTGQYGFLNGISCKNSVCIAVGYYQNFECQIQGPLAYISSDAGNSWAQINTLTLPAGQSAGELSGIG